MYIYVISNLSFEGWLKIGRTINVEKRLSQYQTGDPFRGYKLEYFIETAVPEYYESHFYLDSVGEWIKMSVQECISIIERLNREYLQKGTYYPQEPRDLGNVHKVQYADKEQKICKYKVIIGDKIEYYTSFSSLYEDLKNKFRLLIANKKLSRILKKTGIYKYKWCTILKSNLDTQQASEFDLK